MRLSGTIFNRQGTALRAAHPFAAHDRVVALDEGGLLLGEAFVEQDGDWALSVTKPAKWLIAQLSGRRLAAVVARAATSSVIEMPDLVRLSFTSAVHGAALWLDAIALEGFPKHLVPALRTHPNRIVDLHLATFPTVKGTFQIDVQRGKYRLSGGQIALRSYAKSLQLSQVINESTGTIWHATAGEVVLDVCEPASYRLLFASVDAPRWRGDEWPASLAWKA